MVRDQPKEFYAVGIQKLIARSEKLVAVTEDYIISQSLTDSICTDIYGIPSYNFSKVK